MRLKQMKNWLNCLQVIMPHMKYGKAEKNIKVIFQQKI